jgi:hypothetical protein
MQFFHDFAWNRIQLILAFLHSGYSKGNAKIPNLCNPLTSEIFLLCIDRTITENMGSSYEFFSQSRVKSDSTLRRGK